MRMHALSRESAVALLLLAGAFRGSHAQTIRFVAPQVRLPSAKGGRCATKKNAFRKLTALLQDGSRLWVDDEHPVTLR